MATEKLTQAEINAAVKSFTKKRSLSDGGGLILLVNSPTSASWVYRYKRQNVEKRMGLGSYPDVTLKEARKLAAQARGDKAKGEDPMTARAAVRRRGVTFEEAAREYWQNRCQDLAKPSNWIAGMEKHVFPSIGRKPVVDLAPEDLIALLRPIWGREMTRKLSQWINQVIVYISVDDPRVDVTLMDRAKNRLGPQKIEHEHHAAVPWRKVPSLYQSLPNTLVGLSMRLLILSAVRVNCVTQATWGEFDLRNRVWTIPADRVKGWATGYRVPLTDQMIDAVRSAKRFSHTTDFVFESKDSASRHLSNNAHRLWLHEKGWKDDDGRPATAHGFRSSFRDWAAHARIDSMLAEHCVQHIKAKGSQTERAYFRTDLLEQRREVMEQWADYATRTDAEERRELRGDAWEAAVVRAHEREVKEGEASHDLWEKLRDYEAE
jgi:integrase